MKSRFLAGVAALFLTGTVSVLAQAIGGVVGAGGMSIAANHVPYCADTILITDRTLADGNHIHRESHGKMCRDSQGRTRSENEDNPAAGAQPFTMIHITDPVQRETINLDSRTQTAIIIHFPDPSQRSAIKEPVVAPATQPVKIDMKREDLGTQDIEGVTARGTRMTRTIPPGAEGNDEAIVVVTESWISRELGMNLLSKTVDPRNGTTERRLSNIQRTEPDPALFQVPPDYKVKDNGSPQ